MKGARDAGDGGLWKGNDIAKQHAHHEQGPRERAQLYASRAVFIQDVEMLLAGALSLCPPCVALQEHRELGASWECCWINTFRSSVPFSIPIVPEMDLNQKRKITYMFILQKQPFSWAKQGHLWLYTFGGGFPDHFVKDSVQSHIASALSHLNQALLPAIRPGR